MQIRTTRFGSLELEPSDTIHFPNGLLGFEDCRQWVLLADAGNSALGWLQSTTRPEVALAVVSPRRFVPHYQFKVYRSELAVLELEQVRDAQVLAIVGKNERSITLNLKAPVVINLRCQLGRQVVANGDLPLQHELTTASSTLKKSA
ncbi:MAG TPA: flagellar assembly protein FliW [Pirellulales bacterium]|nr:flagellar assembly protein FliW [Pirellulales bacterium]